jgi:hypothetical protein
MEVCWALEGAIGSSSYPGSTKLEKINISMGIEIHINRGKSCIEQGEVRTQTDVPLQNPNFPVQKMVHSHIFRPCSVTNIQNKYENLMQPADFAVQVWNPDSIMISGITVICIVVSWTSTTITFTVNEDVSCSLQHLLLTLSSNQHSPFCHKHFLQLSGTPTTQVFSLAKVGY